MIRHNNTMQNATPDRTTHTHTYTHDATAALRRQNFNLNHVFIVEGKL